MSLSYKKEGFLEWSVAAAVCIHVAHGRIGMCRRPVVKPVRGAFGQVSNDVVAATHDVDAGSTPGDVPLESARSGRRSVWQCSVRGRSDRRTICNELRSQPTSRTLMSNASDMLINTAARVGVFHMHG